jgi:transaldolase
MGFRGVTTNPPLSLQAIKLAPAMWAAEIKAIAAKNPGLDYEGVYWLMYLDLVKKGADAILPVFEKSGGKYGFLSGRSTALRARRRQDARAGPADPRQGEKRDGQAARLEEGYEVLEELTALGISTNNTTSFTVPQYMRCMSAVTAGPVPRQGSGVDLRSGAR